MWTELRILDLPQLSQLPIKACGHISMKLQDPGEKKRKDVTFMPLPSALPYICYPRVPKACNWVPKSRPFTTLPMGPCFRKKLCMVVNGEETNHCWSHWSCAMNYTCDVFEFKRWFCCSRTLTDELCFHIHCSDNHNVVLRFNLANIR